MSELEKLKNRLCDEQAQLFQKLYRLDDILWQGSKNITAKQEQLLWMQRNAMKMYIDVLQLRINDLQDYIKNNDKIESEVE